ncbi:histidine triad nucleotide-binding protein [Roseateles oligotrophus]|uniref:Histidine triad nucleotide-binding protein n=1 Tax=Roseateles oligotrophus TaxID=1769250 RepID=A0ABT2Y8R4_9BURK|nr:histidine triad nucleotide-binding protein [Roseateles oligotrophus]MCV2366663.1 histidine triad nucleotide-binding protein [Roseateles oligotrophus]
MSHDPDCLFCKIVAGQIPSRKAYEDELVLAFHDIHPWAPVHVLIVPKQHIAMMSELGDEHVQLLGHMSVLAPKLMRDLGVTNGFRTVINTGPDGGQEVYHLHMHVMGGPRPWLKG